MAVYCRNSLARNFFIFLYVSFYVFGSVSLASEFDLFFGNGISHLFSGSANTGKSVNPTGPFYCANPLTSVLRKQSKDTAVIAFDRKVLLPDELSLPVSFCSRLNPDGHSVFQFGFFQSSVEKCHGKYILKSTKHIFMLCGKTKE